MKILVFTGLIFLLFILHSSVFSQTPTPTPPIEEDTEVVKIATTLIRLDVVVTDKKNRPVANLKEDDFEIYEDGKKQEVTNITYVSPKAVNRANLVADDMLGLKNDEDGTNLKEKIAIPTTNKPTDPNNIRRTLVLAVDNLGLSFRSVGLVKKSIEKFIKDQIKDGDLVTVVTTGSATVLPAFTSDKKQLLAIVKKIKWGAQSRGGADFYDPIRPTLLEELSDSRGFDVPGVREETALQADVEAERKSDLAIGTLGALQYVVRGMRNLPGRKALVLFSEGFSLSTTSLRNSSNSDLDTSSQPPKPSSSNRFGSGAPDALQALIQTANQASVVIYPVDPRGLQYLGMANSDDDVRRAFDRDFKPGQTDNKRTNRDAEFRQSQEALKVLASETGGFATLNQNELEKGLEKVIDDQSYYLLSYVTSYEPVNSAQEVYDKVEIRLKDPDLEIRYRNSFYSEEGRLAEFVTPRSAREKVGQALAFPFNSNEIKLNLYSITGNHEQGDFIRFLINISAEDLKFKRSSDGMRTANFDMLAITLNSDEKPIDQFSKNFNFSVNEQTYRGILKNGIVYVLPVVLKKSGVYHFRVAIHDSETGKVGAAAKFLETPKFEKKRLWISNLTFKTVSNSQKVEKENDTKMFTDTTLRQFVLPTKLNYAAIVYNPAKNEGNLPDLTYQTRLILDEKVISESQPMPVNLKDQKDLNRVEISGNLVLNAGLQPGSYIFQVIITDKLAKKKWQAATQLIDFEVLGK